MRAVVPIIPFLLVLVGVSGVPTNVSSTTQPQLQTTGRPSHEAPNMTQTGTTDSPTAISLTTPDHTPPMPSIGLEEEEEEEEGAGDGEHLKGGDGTRDTLPQSPGPAVPLAGDDEKDKPNRPVVPPPGPNNSPARPETSRPKTPPTSIGPLATRPTTQLPSKGRPLVPTPQHTPLFSFLTASPPWTPSSSSAPSSTPYRLCVLLRWRHTCVVVGPDAGDAHTLACVTCACRPNAGRVWGGDGESPHAESKNNKGGGI